MRNNERMRRLRYGSGADFADLSHNPTLARCQARSLELISCSPELDPGSSERERESVLCVAAEGNYKIACEMLGLVSVSGHHLSPNNDNTTQTDRQHRRHSISHRGLHGIDHKLRLIMSWEKLSTYQILNYRCLHESVPCAECSEW